MVCSPSGVIRVTFAFATWRADLRGTRCTGADLNAVREAATGRAAMRLDRVMLAAIAADCCDQAVYRILFGAGLGVV